ncbi:MAG: TIGR04222 domain-containing membrane protein [Pseudomonadales bacterium]|nr:TIGR04222 domain-containing membrane protein [Pseudomonadales bacterium]
MTIATSAGPRSWTDERIQLYERLQAHEFDDPASDFPFTQRLARDNHWPLAYARRVVDEYRRFCFLACVEEEDVTPSDQVDQAWHLHLLYTRDYWGPFGRDVLRRQLHHGPTRGGSVERRRYDDQYTRTRHAYLRWFGEHPPADIWPGATERFSRDVRWVRVNRDDHWLLRKPRLRAVARDLSVVFALLVLMLASSGALAAGDPRPQTLSDAGYDPYELAARPFLWLYALACVGVATTCALSVRTRSRAIGRGRGRGRGTFATDVYTTALLCGGDERVLLAALTKLVDGGHLTVSSSGEIRTMDTPDPGAHPLERALYDEVEQHGGLTGGALFEKSRLLPRARLRAQRDEAERAGLLLRAWERPSAELWIASLFPAAFAAPRILAALPADRPMGWLIALLLLATIGGPAIVAASRTALTEGGRVVLARARRRALQLKARRPTLAGDELLFGAAVLGGAFLSGTVLADVRQAVPSGDGGASSGGDGGDGGCGGGGCGGCGG